VTIIDKRENLDEKYVKREDLTKLAKSVGDIFTALINNNNMRANYYLENYQSFSQRMGWY